MVSDTRHSLNLSIFTDSEGFVMPDFVNKSIIQERQSTKFTNTTYTPSNVNGLPYQIVIIRMKIYVLSSGVTSSNVILMVLNFRTA